MLWLAAAADSAEDYAAAAAVVDEHGGINPDYLAEPPSVISLDERHDPWWEDFDREATAAPTMEDFRTRFLQPGRWQDVIALALAALLSDDTVCQWALAICASLTT